FFRSAPTSIYPLSLHDALPIFVGELMITAGVLLGLFVVWQLWWTDVEAHGRQAQVLEEWDKQENVIDAPAQEGERRTDPPPLPQDRKSTRLNSSHVKISYAVFC